MNLQNEKTVKRSADETKKIILAAARKIAVKDGVARLTIEAVAKKAGVSKGGVLYHYPSKKKLIMALMDQYVAHLNEELETALEQNRDKPYALVYAFMDWFKRRDGIAPENRDWGAAIFTVQSFDMSLMEPLHQWYRNLFQRIRDSVGDQAKTTLGVIALEGFFMLSLYNVDYSTPEEREKVFELIKELLNR